MCPPSGRYVLSSTAQCYAVADVIALHHLRSGLAYVICEHHLLCHPRLISRKALKDVGLFLSLLLPICHEMEKVFETMFSFFYGECGIIHSFDA